MRAITLRAVAGILLIVPCIALILNSRSGDVSAQPTYKLDVKPHLKPLSALKLEGTKLSRTDLDDDPGFRLQFHIKLADGKTASTVEARSATSIDLEAKTAGTFSVVLELFYPAYKGGTGQKGEFKPVSNVLTYKVDGGKITLFELLPAPKGSSSKD